MSGLPVISSFLTIRSWINSMHKLFSPKCKERSRALSACLLILLAALAAPGNAFAVPKTERDLTEQKFDLNINMCYISYRNTMIT